MLPDAEPDAARSCDALERRGVISQHGALKIGGTDDLTRASSQISPLHGQHRRRHTGGARKLRHGLLLCRPGRTSVERDHDHGQQPAEERDECEGRADDRRTGPSCPNRTRRK
jgi:hypothetical protein